MKSRSRFPLHNNVLPAKVYQVRDRNWALVAEVTAGSAAEAMEIARVHWPEARSAHIKENEKRLCA